MFINRWMNKQIMVCKYNETLTYWCTQWHKWTTKLLCLVKDAKTEKEYIWGGTQKMEFIYKNCVFILTCLNFSHLQSTLHVMQYTYRDVFLVLKTVLNSLILITFSASAIFCFTSSTLAKHFPLINFSIRGNKKVIQARLSV